LALIVNQYVAPSPRPRHPAQACCFGAGTFAMRSDDKAVQTRFPQRQSMLDGSMTKIIICHVDTRIL
jgi:hypothetical protein